VARTIIRKAIKRTGSRAEVSEFYGISPIIVERYLENGNRDCGPLNARHVMRVEMARLQAFKEGNKNFKPTDKDRYKGTR
jgi:hypothetical protein